MARCELPLNFAFRVAAQKSPGAKCMPKPESVCGSDTHARAAKRSATRARVHRPHKAQPRRKFHTLAHSHNSKTHERYMHVAVREMLLHATSEAIGRMYALTGSRPCLSVFFQASDERKEGKLLGSSMLKTVTPSRRKLLAGPIGLWPLCIAVGEQCDAGKSRTGVWRGSCGRTENSDTGK
eukprot:5486251-Pleurochrysis_carterae.AAC.13